MTEAELLDAMRDLRRRARLSQEEMARLIQTSVTRVSRMERRLVAVTLEDAIRWVTACGAELRIARPCS